MQFNPIDSISPIDGRYHLQTQALKSIFSEYGLIKYRVVVEIEWLKALSTHNKLKEIPPLSKKAINLLDALQKNFSTEDALAIKNIEKRTNHDVKAVEYWIKEQFSQLDELQQISEFVHFSCTSEDINNLAYALMIKSALNNVFLPQMNQIHAQLQKMAHDHRKVSMLARTHGQPATPTTLGKEIANIAYRYQRQLQQISNVPIFGKINGAVGNYNAHMVAYPDVDWPKFAKNFISKQLKLKFNPYTTQIEPHDYIAELSDAFSRSNTILIDFARDAWGYISIGYFKQKNIEGEVGSSTMPHKINPIDFENAEGNLGIANALFTHFSSKLPISRWQRDLSDSTVLRSVGTAFAYTLIAYTSLLKGCNKLEVNLDAIHQDLENNIEVLGEAVQTVMRRYGIPEPYEKLKAFTRGRRITQAEMLEFIDTLELSEDVKNALKKLTPSHYIGLASELAKKP